MLINAVIVHVGTGRKLVGLATYQALELDHLSWGKMILTKSKGNANLKSLVKTTHSLRRRVNSDVLAEGMSLHYTVPHLNLRHDRATS